MQTLQTAMVGRKNHFNLIRMVAASAVLVSHAYPIALGPAAAEPLEAYLHLSLGTLAVALFFVISGFFISQSFDRRTSVTAFVVARVLRVYPALVLVLVLTVFIVGPAFTTLPWAAYLADPQTALYVPRNLTLKWLQYDLPGVFAANPYPGAINGSLWSLFYEICCYGLVMVVFAPAIKRYFSVFLGVYLIVYLVTKVWVHPHQLLLVNFHQLTLPFVIGMTFYHLRRLISLSVAPLLLGVGVSLLVYHTEWFEEAFVLTWSYLIFYLGLRQGKIMLAYNRLGDYSYGTYIYAFPCEQILAGLLPGVAPVELILLSAPLTLLCAVLSWHVLEDRALAARGSVARWFEQRYA